MILQFDHVFVDSLLPFPWPTTCPQTVPQLPAQSNEMICLSFTTSPVVVGLCSASCFSLASSRFVSLCFSTMLCGHMSRITCACRPFPKLVCRKSGHIISLEAAFKFEVIARSSTMNCCYALGKSVVLYIHIHVHKHRCAHVHAHGAHVKAGKNPSGLQNRNPSSCPKPVEFDFMEVRPVREAREGCM